MAFEAANLCARSWPPWAMPAVMGDGLKPLTASQRPSDSSHKKIGTPAITVKAVTGWSPQKNAVDRTARDIDIFEAFLRGWRLMAIDGYPIDRGR